MQTKDKNQLKVGCCLKIRIWIFKNRFSNLLQKMCPDAR